ncbi:hypothetical protein, variant 2 [Phytophthora nicotianae INRA-310]|nr:hypothetical protein, variant 2 [Phytophthora nicotianae INRA-310]ETN18579.1 hypothetical protein, variant 2 [Phytophthora nicotianae INRA-310]
MSRAISKEDEGSDENDGDPDYHPLLDSEEAEELYTNSDESTEDQPVPTQRTLSDLSVPSPIRKFVPSIENHEFSSWEEFESFRERYEKEHFVCNRIRDSRTVKWWSNKYPHRALPSSFEYAFRRYACTLGCRQKSRGSGKRTVRTERFRGCAAEFRAVLALSESDKGRWVVKVQNEMRCHNHNLTKQLYVAMKRCKDLIDDTLLEQLEAFVETSTSTKQMTDYVSRKTGLPFTPQQIRNLINSRLGGVGTEDRVKAVITEFVQSSANHCLLIQDEWGLTIGIVLQNAAQKEIFKRWGENLVLDWTHNTNNIGFYLGSLVVTVANGRGISAVDFLCMNQQKETLQAVLRYFKKQNPSWTGVESLTIDKDFTEMAALQVEFPDANIFLCQFHVLRYIRRMLGTRAYFVSFVKRAEVEDLFRSLLYASSRQRYLTRKLVFEKRVHEISPGFLEYFRRCWDTCSERWSNYGRRRRFSAGNTTTNRIESSWNQFKQLLGKKSSIDKCLQVVVQQQSCVLRDFLTSIGGYLVKSPNVIGSRPPLAALGQVLSPYCFERVRRQWDYHISYGAEWRWHYSATPTGDVYKLASAIGTGVEVVWVPGDVCMCNCLFQVSTRLPCQHLFSVMVKCRDMPVFDVAQLSTRWSMPKAATVEPIMAETLQHLYDVRDAKYVDNQASTAPYRFGAAKRRVGYAKVKRGEHCDQAVLSDCEKFNVVQAEFFPLIRAMQRLPSHEFYPRFAELRSILATFKRKWNMDTTNIPTEGAVDGGLDHEADSEFSSEIEADDAAYYGVSDQDQLDGTTLHAVAHSQEDASGNGSPVTQNDSSGDAEIDLDTCCVEDPSQVTQPDLVISEASQELLEMAVRADDTSTAVSTTGNAQRAFETTESEPKANKKESATSDTTSDIAQRAQLPRGNEVSSDSRGVDVINLPKPSVATPRSGKKRTRLGIIYGNCDCPIRLDEFLTWAVAYPDLNRVREIIDRFPVRFDQMILRKRTPVVVMRKAAPSDFVYNFLLPQGIQASITSELIQWASDNNYVECVEDDEPDSIPVAYYSENKDWAFSLKFTELVHDVYAVRGDIDSYKEDLAWVERDWPHEASICLPFLPIVTHSLRDAAHEVAQRLAESWLSRRFTFRAGIKGSGGRAELRGILGFLAGKTRLNDVVMHAMLQRICSGISKSFAIDPVNVIERKMKFPSYPLSRYSHVVVPVYMKTLEHWMIQIVELPAMSQSETQLRNVALVLYDPLGPGHNSRFFEDTWSSYTLPLLKEWSRRDCALIQAKSGSKSTQLGRGDTIREIEQPKEITLTEVDDSVVKMRWLPFPVQGDAVSCGVFFVLDRHTATSLVAGRSRKTRRFLQIIWRSCASVSCERFCARLIVLKTPQPILTIGARCRRSTNSSTSTSQHRR